MSSNQEQLVRQEQKRAIMKRLRPSVACRAADERGLFSGTFAAHVGRYFIVTAKHALDGIRDFRSLRIISLRNNLSAFSARTRVRYEADKTYEVRMVVNTARRTYSVYIAKAGSAEASVAQEFKFQSTATPAPLSVLAFRASAGTFKVS